MFTPRRCLALMALAAYLLVGGLVGLCALWSGLDIEHHHHDGHDHDHGGEAGGSFCAAHASDCDEPSQPCRDSADQDGGELSARLPDSPSPIVSPLIGIQPTPNTKLVAAVSSQRVSVHAALRDVVRGSPPTRPALLCRFLV